MNDPLEVFMRAIQASVMAQASVDKYAAAVQAAAIQALDASDASDAKVLVEKLRELSAMAGDAAGDFTITKVALKQAAEAYEASLK